MSLVPIIVSEECSVYDAGNYQGVKRIIVSTPETRAICNDPFVLGFEYTNKLKTASSKALKALSNSNIISLSENLCSVLHILRGGLNFCLREALAEAFGWNAHASNFISAQRAQKDPNSEDWIITEDSYKKLHLQEENQIIFGDVVATGTSLEYGIKRILEHAVKDNCFINSLTFFTIGGPRSHEILAKINKELAKSSTIYSGATVIYFEGIFNVATLNSTLSISIAGTDLLRAESVMAPEFIESQYQSPAFPLERCTIYDAGSRSFEPKHYLEDIKDYWNKTLKLADNGMSFSQLLKERFPELDPERFKNPDLRDVCLKQLNKIG